MSSGEASQHRMFGRHRSACRGGRWLLGLVAACLAVCATATQAQGIDCLPASVPGWAGPELPARQSVVVFLHGLHGDGLTTWATSNKLAADSAWPCLVRADAESFPATSTYLAHYRSVMLGGNPDTRQIARDLAHDLVTGGVFQHAQVTVVAHSMGGIVLARLLTEPGLLTAEQRRRIRLVVFLGTPAEPTEAARICDRFGINPQCSEMIDEGEMKKLWLAWDALSPRPPTLCAAEGSTMFFPRLALQWPWLLVVPDASAHRPCQVPGPYVRTTTLYGLNHGEIAKPQGVGSLPHRTLQQSFDPCVRRGIRPEAQLAADVTQAVRVRPWFDGLMARLSTDGTDGWKPVLLAALHPEQRKLFFPPGGDASFVAEDYQMLFPAAFADELVRVASGPLGVGDFQWVRPVRQVRERLTDGAMTNLTGGLTSKARLMDDDLLVALKPFTSQPGVLWLLAVRPLLQAEPATAPSFALVGMLAVRSPLTDCSATLAAR